LLAWWMFRLWVAWDNNLYNVRIFRKTFFLASIFKICVESHGVDLGFWFWFKNVNPFSKKIISLCNLLKKLKICFCLLFQKVSRVRYLTFSFLSIFIWSWKKPRFTRCFFWKYIVWHLFMCFRLRVISLIVLTQEDIRFFEIQVLEKTFFCQGFKAQVDVRFKVLKSWYNKKRALFCLTLVKGLFKLCKSDLPSHLDLEWEIFFFKMALTDK
jgi:hypothetical protein